MTRRSSTTDAPTRISNAYGRFAVIPRTLVLDRDLSDGAVRLYLLLWDYSNATEREAWPTRSTMGSDLGVSVDTIDRRVAELEQRGAISITVDLSSDARRNVYTILQLKDEVIPKGRKSAAQSDAGVGRKSAAKKGRKSAVPYKEEPEPGNQTDTVRSPKQPTDEGVDNSGPTGPNPASIPHPTVKALDHAAVFAAVGEWLPSRFTDELLDTLAGEILERAATPVLPQHQTKYVVTALVNTVGPAERRRDFWLLRAREIADEALVLQLRRAGA